MNKWQNFNFKINWAENTQPKWWVDIYLVDLVVRTVVENFKKDITLWRIHRRALRDKSGHELALICFCEQSVANKIHNFIFTNKFLEVAVGFGLIDKFTWEEKSKNNKLNINDLSDKAWPPALQKSWPYFICGTSEMFLELIEQVKITLALEKLDIEKLSSLYIAENYFSRLNNTLLSIWKIHGSHAYFHHLNSIFGYAPMIVQLNNIQPFIASF